MEYILGVRFRCSKKIFYFKTTDFDYCVGDGVVCKTVNSVEFGEVVLILNSDDFNGKGLMLDELNVLLRKATEKDINRNEENKKHEEKAFEIAASSIKKYNLNMKLVSTYYSFDRVKVIFFFTSNERVDFRALLKRLAYLLHVRVELRQIGIRDAAKIVSGVGICGRPFCCATFLTDFHHVTIKMAKEQNLSLNPKKISGCCGKLMCCLKYEQNAYAFLNKVCPKIGSTVMSPDGEGVILNGNPLIGKYRLKIDTQYGSTERVFNRESLKIIKDNNEKKQIK